MIGNLPVLWTLSALTEILFTPLSTSVVRTQFKANNSHTQLSFSK